MLQYLYEPRQMHRESVGRFVPVTLDHDRRPRQQLKVPTTLTEIRAEGPQDCAIKKAVYSMPVVLLARASRGRVSRE